MWDKINWKKVGIFFGGFAFGTVGLKALFSKDAKDINEDRKAAEEAVFEDTSKSYKEVESTEE